MHIYKVVADGPWGMKQMRRVRVQLTSDAWTSLYAPLVTPCEHWHDL